MLKRAIVTWEDSASTGGWHHSSDVNRVPMICETTGYVVSRDAKSIVMALNAAVSKDSNSNHGDYITIPARAVLKIRRIK